MRRAVRVFPRRAWSVLPRRWYTSISVDPGRPKTRRGKCVAERQADPATETIPPERVVKLLDDIEEGLTDMKRANEHFDVRRSSLSLTIDIGGGQAYHLGLAETGTEIDLQSPARLGSLTKYVYVPEEDAFKSPKDGHDLIEMLSRDLVYTSKGMPLF